MQRETLVPLAGFRFRSRDDKDVWEQTDEGTILCLVPEPENEYDENAIKVCNNENGTAHFGYVPRTHSWAMTTMLAAGLKVDCVKEGHETLRLVVHLPQPDTSVGESAG